MVVTLDQQYDTGEKPSVMLYTYIHTYIHPYMVITLKRTSSNNHHVKTKRLYF